MEPKEGDWVLFKENRKYGRARIGKILGIMPGTVLPYVIKYWVINDITDVDFFTGYQFDVIPEKEVIARRV